MAGLTAIKRKGFKGGGSDASTTSFSESYDRQMGNDPGTTKGNPASDKSEREGQDEADRNNNRIIANRINKQQKEAIAKQKIKNDFIQKSKRDNVIKNPFADFFSKQRQKSMNKTARINKFKTLQKLNQLPKDQLSKTQLAFMATNPMYGIGKLISGQTKVNLETDMFDIDSIKEIASQTQYTPTFNPATGKTTYGTTAQQAKQLGYLKQDIDMNTRNDITQNEFDDYMNRKKITTFEGGGNPNILPQYAMMGGGADMGSEDVEEEKTYDYHLGLGGQQVGADVLRGYAADGGIMELRARRAFGGIMDRVTGRKAYGLGSIFKKVGKAAKKVLSSDIGKAAIAGAAIYYGGGGTFKPGGSSTFQFGNLFNSNNKLLFSGSGTKADPNKFNPFKFTGITTLAGALAGPAKVDSLEGFSNRGGQLIDPISGEPNDMAGMRENIELAKLEAGDDVDKLAAIDAKYNNMLNLAYQANLPDATPYIGYGKPGYRTTVATGGRIGKAEGGLMDLGGMEKDYRNDGGFVPIGEYEKKDDVPARLSVNEFVFTADAVRGAGGGDIDKGAEIMENVMKNLEDGGQMSKESQGNTGAQDMFSVSQRLGEVL